MANWQVGGPFKWVCPLVHLKHITINLSLAGWGRNRPGDGEVAAFCGELFLEFRPAGFFYGIITLRPGGRIRSLHPVPTPWTDTNETGLVALKNAPIEMADTLYGRFLATQKRDAERAFQH
jgi:hypothetical protein